MNQHNKLTYFFLRHAEFILRLLKILTLVSSILVLGVMVYHYGFIHTEENINLIIIITRFFYLIFIVSFFVRFFLSTEKRYFLGSNAFEALLVLLVIYDGISYFLIGHPVLENLLIWLKIPNYRAVYHFFIQFFLLFFASIEIVKSINSVYTTKLKPTTLFLFSFIILIAGGSLLLMLPGFNRNGVYLNYVDALFTSASASCVTGLTVVNTATFFNIKGQLIILILIQLGGIGILTFASFFASFIKKGMAMKHQIAMNELLDAENISGSFHLIKRILVMTFIIEGLGALGIYMLWGEYPFSGPGEKIYVSIFHSISSFCNAGFSTFELGFETPLVNELYMLHIFMGVVIFFGGLGFPVLRDVFSPSMLRARLLEPWKDWKLSSKIAIFTSIILIITGMLVFYILHVQSHYGGKSPIEKFAIAFFQSVNLRTSGFNSISLEHLPDPLLMFSMFLMFIGASSASTGGGIKTSTFVVMMVALIGTIRGQKEMTLGNRGIAKELIYKAFAVVIFSGLYILMVITILSLTESGTSLVNLAYEAVSAFATVGLSTGITAGLSDPGKLVLVISMFVGRVGIITLAYSLSTRTVRGDFRYASTHMMIG